MKEIIVNIHTHTTYSDGAGAHADIAKAAQQAGVDVVFVTDHNVYVHGMDGYYGEGDHRVLLLVGEEVHDQARQPQKSHLLVLGAGRELAAHAYQTQHLVEMAHNAGALTFIAHPFDPPAPAFGETDITWEDWDIRGVTGIEIWNGLSELKNYLKGKLRAIRYVLNPELVALGAAPQALQKWDELLKAGRRLVAIGGSDAHALNYRWGPIRREIFPYEFHFRAINNHIFTQEPLTGSLVEDRRLILDALKQGRSFIGYDLPAPTSGFRFSAQGRDQKAWMGEPISGEYGVTFQIRLPRPAVCRLIRDGKVVKTWEKRDTCTYITNDTGAYRVEVDIDFLGRRRAWIYSNPIYVRK